MKRGGSAKYIIIIFFTAFFSSMAGYISGTRANSEEKTAKESSAFSFPQEEKSLPFSAESIPLSPDAKKAVTTTYVLREKNGKLCLFSKFSDGGENLYGEYDISVKLLPASDRELLKNGIEAETLSEALSLIEDYSS